MATLSRGKHSPAAEPKVFRCKQPQLATLPSQTAPESTHGLTWHRAALPPVLGKRQGLSSAAAAEKSLKEAFECAEQSGKELHSQVGDAGGLHVGQGRSVGAEGRGAVDQGAVLSQALQDTNPLLTPLLQSHSPCHLPPESHTERGVNATLQTPPADLLRVFAWNIAAFSLPQPWAAGRGGGGGGGCCPL